MKRKMTDLVLVFIVATCIYTNIQAASYVGVCVPAKKVLTPIQITDGCYFDGEGKCRGSSNFTEYVVNGSCDTIEFGYVKIYGVFFQ
jgi:hypothetical protein